MIDDGRIQRVGERPYLEKVFYGILLDRLKAGKPIDYRAEVPKRNPAYSHFSSITSIYGNKRKRAKK